MARITLRLFTISDLPTNISCRVGQQREDEHAITLTVRVVPRASRSEIAGYHDGALRVRVAAPPVEGAANRELIKFLSKSFRVPQNAVTIISGSNSRNKIIRITNPSAVMLEELSKLK
jgi:uncharacterized protein (TIGR00251 family)